MRHDISGMRALVFDVIIAGLGCCGFYRRDSSGKLLCTFWRICLPLHVSNPHARNISQFAHLLIHVYQGALGHLAGGLLFPSPNFLVWFLFQLSLPCCCWSWLLGVVCCFIPQSSRLSSEVRGVNDLVSGRRVGGAVLLVPFLSQTSHEFSDSFSQWKEIFFLHFKDNMSPKIDHRSHRLAHTYSYFSVSVRSPYTRLIP